MSNNELSIGYNLTIPEFGDRKAVTLDLSKSRNAESRIIEAKTVTLASYPELEYAYNEGYRECKYNLVQIGYELTQAEKALRKSRSEALLDRYPEFLKEKGLKDNGSIRDAFLEKQEDILKAQDRIDMLKAMEQLLDGKIKVFENTCRYMKKVTDIVMRSGFDSNKYIR